MDTSTDFLETPPAAGKNFSEKLKAEHTRIKSEAAAPEPGKKRGRPAGYRKVNGEWVKGPDSPEPGPASSAEPVVLPSISVDQTEGMKLFLGLIIVFILGVDLSDKELEYGAKLHLWFIEQKAPAVVKENVGYGYLGGFWALVLVKRFPEMRELLFGGKSVETERETETPQKTDSPKNPPPGFSQRSTGPGKNGSASGPKGHQFF